MLDRTMANDRPRHVHLENDVLFPAAMRLEARLSGSPETGA
jgi:iron-sulfur cluster repair protein YtfE (RIC family)